MAGNGRRDGLTARQSRALAALLAHGTIEGAAEAAHVGARTLHRWLAEDPDFRRALSEAEGLAIAEATRQLIALQGKAIRTLDTCMDDGNWNTARLAAVAVLSQGMKLRELQNLEQRLAALEAAIDQPA